MFIRGFGKIMKNLWDSSDTKYKNYDEAYAWIHKAVKQNYPETDKFLRKHFL